MYTTGQGLVEGYNQRSDWDIDLISKIIKGGRMSNINTKRNEIRKHKKKETASSDRVVTNDIAEGDQMG